MNPNVHDNGTVQSIFLLVKRLNITIVTCCDSLMAILGIKYSRKD